MISMAHGYWRDVASLHHRYQVTTTLRVPNRSGKVERPFHDYEHNFLAGRTFTDWDDLRSWLGLVRGQEERSSKPQARPDARQFHA